MTALTDQLKALDKAVATATAAWTEARRKSETDPWPRDRESIAPLREYSDGVRYRKSDADPDEERRLVAELVDRVKAEGLTFRPMPAGNPGVLEIFDPVPDAIAADAHRALRSAQSERDAFVKTNAAE